MPISIDQLKEYVDLDRLRAWMDEQQLGKGAIEDCEILAGGTQNILLKFSRAKRWFVLRRPPHNPYMNGNETIRREIRILESLANTEVPHARLIAACKSENVLGAAFYLMQAVDGFSAARGLPTPHLTDPHLRYAMGMALIDALVSIYRVDPVRVGLQDFGRPEGYLPRQIGRLLKQYGGYSSYDGWAGGCEAVVAEKLARWLLDNMPDPSRPGIVHGDFHIGNAMFSRTTADVRAIVDWELATLGDPACDLGCLLATWADPDGSHPGCISVTPWSGFPTEAELVRQYVEGTGHAVDANWHTVFGCFRLGILVEGTYARALAGKADMETGLWLHQTSINLFDRALRRLA
jgi:aminoglycoside phosphotransferase (APT) family kinase protein